jgi:rhodanese-related sulfurtransferase
MMKTITRDQLKHMLEMNDDMLVINVLSRDQFERAHIPGSVNVPLEEGDSGEFAEHIFELAGSYDKRIIVYCANEMCSASDESAKLLDKEGFKAVFVYKGGIKDWIDAGNMTEGSMRAAA